MGLGRMGKWERDRENTTGSSHSTPRRKAGAATCRGAAPSQSSPACGTRASRRLPRRGACPSLPLLRLRIACWLLADHHHQRARWHLLVLLEARQAELELHLLLVMDRTIPAWSATSVGNGAHTRCTWSGHQLSPGRGQHGLQELRWQGLQDLGAERCAAAESKELAAILSSHDEMQRPGCMSHTATLVALR